MIDGPRPLEPKGRAQALLTLRAACLSSPDPTLTPASMSWSTSSCTVPNIHSLVPPGCPVGPVLGTSAKSLQHCLTLRCHGLWPARLLCPWDSPGKNTGVGSHAFLQGIFLTQGLNPRLMSPALAGEFFTTSATWEALSSLKLHINYSFHTLYSLNSFQPRLLSGTSVGHLYLILFIRGLQGK